MSNRDEASLHAERAHEELERARAAVSPEAAIAHLGLSELHLGRMRDHDIPAMARLRLVGG